MNTEQAVARHYTHGSLEQAILAALKGIGKDVDRLTLADLSAADEFHLGWRAMSAEIGKDLGLSPQMRVLDVGSGIGGPARYFADAHGCHVTGIDLTEEFVQVAGALSRRCGLGDKVDFHAGSALDMPFEDATFDAATMIHVGMNIEDKERLFREVRRVLKPGSQFCVYEVMQVQPGDLPYPMPWAQTIDTSFVATPDAYRQLLGKAGFQVETEINRRDFVLDLARKMQEKVAVEGAPPVSLHILMGPAARDRLGNVMATLQKGMIAPIEMIARA